MKAIGHRVFLPAVLILAWAAADSQAAFQQTGWWVDKDFDFGSIRRVALSLGGKWSGSAAELTLKDVARNLRNALGQKGYEVVQAEEGAGEGDPADAVLRVDFRSLTRYGNHRTILVNAELDLTRGTKKAVYKVSGEVWTVGKNTAESEVSDLLKFLPDCGAGARKGGGEKK